MPNDEWRSLRGILSGHPDHDTTAARKAERESELEHDERELVLFPSSRTEYVLDTWPMMEWLKDRKWVADRVADLIERAEAGEIVLRMSRINLGEVFYSSYKAWGAQRAEGILGRMLRLPILYAAVSDETVESAARLKAAHRICYADAFAFSLSMVHGCSLIAVDPDFQALAAKGLLSLEWLGG